MFWAFWTTDLFIYFSSLKWNEIGWNSTQSWRSYQLIFLELCFLQFINGHYIILLLAVCAAEGCGFLFFKERTGPLTNGCPKSEKLVLTQTHGSHKNRGSVKDPILKCFFLLVHWRNPPVPWIISETQKWQIFYSDVLKKKIDFEKFHKLRTGGHNSTQKSESHPTPVHTLLQKQHISSPLISMLLCAWSQPKKLIRARLIAVNKSQVSSTHCQ